MQKLKMPINDSNDNDDGELVSQKLLYNARIKFHGFFHCSINIRSLFLSVSFKRD